MGLGVGLELGLRIGLSLQLGIGLMLGLELGLGLARDWVVPREKEPPALRLTYARGSQAR